MFLGPVSRFGDTAANAGILALLQSNSYLKDLPSPVKTIFASLWYNLPQFHSNINLNPNFVPALRPFEWYLLPSIP